MAAPPIGKQAAGYYRYLVGSYEVTVVTDGMNVRPLPDNFILNATKDQVNAALAAAHLEENKLAVPYSPIIVNTGSKLVLIDTGTGEGNFEATKGAAGQFLRNLAAAGIDREAIDVVIISHFHGDHVNGLLMGDGNPAFPEAEVTVPKVEWEFWMDDGEMSRATPGRMLDLFNNNRRIFGKLQREVSTYDWHEQIVQGITAVPTPGHTPGHTSFLVNSGSSTLFVQSDVTNIPFLFATNPGWHATFDQDPNMAEETRRKVYDMLSAEKMLVQGFHFPFPAIAHVEKDGSGYRVIPAPWNPIL